jgi:uncharacterized damage-inducible protein DinB
MSSTLTDRYRRWFEYEQDVHLKTLASLNDVPDELRQANGFQKAIKLFAHIVAARAMWLHRFGVSAEPAELFPGQVDLADLPGRLDQMQAAWSAYLQNLNDADLQREFEYQSYEGPRFRSSIEDILTQLFGHSWYHRGQIAMLLRSIGAEPAVTDFVFWSRAPISQT